ncbi:MAG: hypothetical protein AAF566_02065 [Pseudomonadota bacterium]
MAFSAAQQANESALQSSDKAYFTGALGVLSSRVAAILAGVASLWLLTRILGSEAFAGYSVAFSIVVLLGYSIGLGIERSLLLRISGLDPAGGRLQGARLMRRILIVVAVLSSLAVVGTLLTIAGETGPKHDFLRLLTPVIPAVAISLVLITWYQANHRVGVSQTMQGLNDATRCTLFGITFAAGLGATGVAAGAILGAAAPAVFLAWRAMGQTRPEPATIGLSDIGDGIQFLIMRMSKMGLQHLGIIALGILGTTTGTAQFAVALRFATLIESGQTVFTPTFAPRVRRHLSLNQMDLAAREYRIARVTGFTAALGLALIFMVVGEPILRQFGDFGVSSEAFLVLIASYLMTVGAGMHSTFLAMTDQLGRSTATRVLSIAIFALGLWILVPQYDAFGAALAFMIATAVHETVGVIILMRYLGVRPCTLPEAAVVVTSCATLCGAGIGFVPIMTAAGILAAMLAATALYAHKIFFGIAKDLYRIAFRRAT